MFGRHNSLLNRKGDFPIGKGNSPPRAPALSIRVLFDELEVNNSVSENFRRDGREKHF